MTWILLHNNDDQGSQAVVRAKNAKLEFIEVALPQESIAVYQNMINARSQIGNGNFNGIIYSGHGRNDRQNFLSTNGKNLNINNFARLLGLAQPPRIVFFSCFGGSIVRNKLATFRQVDNINVPNVNHLANLNDCWVEGPENAIIGASIQEDIRTLNNNPNYQPYVATGLRFQILTV
jgi:hypothetical protein